MSTNRVNSRVYADFHNADSYGRLRLNGVGTVDDLSQQLDSEVSGKRAFRACTRAQTSSLILYFQPPASIRANFGSDASRRSTWAMYFSPCLLNSVLSDECLVRLSAEALAIPKTNSA